MLNKTYEYNVFSTHSSIVKEAIFLLSGSRSLNISEKNIQLHLWNI
jgi:hypothetical protein